MYKGLLLLSSHTTRRLWLKVLAMTSVLANTPSANLAHTMVGGNTKEQDEESETNAALCFFRSLICPYEI